MWITELTTIKKQLVVCLFDDVTDSINKCSGNSVKCRPVEEKCCGTPMGITTGVGICVG